jgi:hypothetical protein
MRKKIGEFLVSKGVLTPSQVEQILNYARIKGMRFGEAGLEMGLLSKESLIKAFGPNYMVDFFHLVPEYFPEATRHLFQPEFLLKWGVLPLGYKTVWKFFRTKKLLNVGLVDPSRKESLDAVKAEVTQALGEGVCVGTKQYLILADEFVSVLEKVYQVPPNTIAELDAVDPTVKLFVDSGV